MNSFETTAYQFKEINQHGKETVKSETRIEEVRVYDTMRNAA